MRTLSIISLVVVNVLAASLAYGQDAVTAVLHAVEENSKELKARRELTSTQKLEANTGKYLANPTVEYSYEWGSPSSVGTSNELVIKQQFDFPTTYASKSRLANLRSSMYDQEGAAFRQDYLLEAKLLIVELIGLRRQQQFLKEQVVNAENLSKFYATKMKAGEANVLESNKIDVELINARAVLDVNVAAADAAFKQLELLNGGAPLSFDAVDYPQLQNLPVDSLVRRNLESNPNLKSLEGGIGVAAKEVSLARALSLPKFDLGYRQNITDNDKFRGVVVGLSIPLFENKNTVKRAKAQYQLAQVQLESSQVKLTNEVQQRYQQAVALREAASRLRERFTSIDGAKFLNKALNAGEISVTTYFVELASFYQSRQALLDMEKEYNRLMAMLYRFEL